MFNIIKNKIVNAMGNYSQVIVNNKSVISQVNIGGNVVIGNNLVVSGDLIGSGGISNNFIKGNGNVITDQFFERIPFNKVDIISGADVYYSKGEDYKVTAQTDSNLMEFLDIRINGDKIIVKLKDGSYSFTTLKVYITAPYITNIMIKGSGDFIGENLDHPNLDVNIFGSGDTTLTGTASNLNVKIKGSGNFNGKEFLVSRANVDVFGSGNVKIRVTDDLQAKINGSGDLKYWGNPTNVNTNVFGSGKVKKK